jgi:hypothetical protein
MSVEMISLVLNQSRAEGRAKLVLIGIANHHGDNGAWPSIETLARYANASERSIKRDLAYLQELGELSVEINGSDFGGQYKTNKYWITLSGVTDWISGVTGQVTRGDRLGKSGVTDVAHKPSIETYINLYAQFEEFWNVYPRKVSKRAALKAYESALVRSTHDEILAGAIRFANDPNLPPAEFIPYPTTWLNGDRWGDGLLPERTKSKEELLTDARKAEELRRDRDKAIERQRALEDKMREEEVKKNAPKLCIHDRIVYNCYECKLRNRNKEIN